MKGPLKCSVNIKIDGGDGEFIILDKGLPRDHEKNH